jgi:O-antigen ligase
LVGGMLFFKRKSIICASAMLFAINFVALIYNKTLGSVLAVIATVIFGLAILFFMLPKKAKKYTLISFSAAVLCGLVFVFTNNSIKNKFTEITDIIKAGGTEADKLGSGRYGLWRSTLEYIGEKPIFGYGPDGISQRLLAEQGAARTHNIFLEYTAFFGIPAVLVFLAGYVFVVIKSLRRFTPLNSAALLGGFAITMSLLTGISFGQTSPILYVLLGMSIASMDSFSNPVGTQSKPISNPVGTQSKPISKPVGTQSKLISPTQKPVEQISNPIETQLEQLDPSQKPTKMSKVQLNFFSGKKIE